MTNLLLKRKAREIHSLEHRLSEGPGHFFFRHDNILRPMLIGQVRMHTVVVFFSILGGIAYFGILGMFFGPLVFAIAVAFLEFCFASPESGTDSI